MTALAIYTTEFDPERLYRTEDFTHDVDDRLREFVRAGDRPLDLLVDTEARRILWLFKAQRKTSTTRTGYFLADYRAGPDTDLFGGFEREMRTLHERDDWTLPYQDDARWDAGFNLWRVDGQYPGVAGDAVSSFRSALDGATQQDEPLVFGMRDHHRAQQVLKALHADSHGCSVAIAERFDDNIADLDLMLTTGSQNDFEPRSAASMAVFERTGRSDTSRSDGSNSQFDRPSLGSRAGGAVLLVILAFSAYSFVSPKPFHPITGLAAFGGLFGSLMSYAILTADSTDTVETMFERFRHRLLENTDQSIVLIAYGTTLAFAFPTIFRVGGQLLGSGQWVFGPVTTIANTLPSLVLFGSVLFALNFGLLRAYPRAVPGRSFDRSTGRRLALAHAVYALPLFILTGLARDVWFVLVPSL